MILITKTIVSTTNGNITYMDEFPNSVILSKIINYLMDVKKIGIIKNINIKYEKTRIYNE
jgi:hypothetical protein